MDLRGDCGAGLVILVPVLGRPHKVPEVMESALLATPEASLLFLPSPDDAPEIEALEQYGAEWLAVDGGWAAKLNEGIRQTDQPLIFAGADDLHWHPGWYERACARIEAGAEVVGVNDLCSERVKAGIHATHFMLTREYAELPDAGDEPGAFNEGYHHWYVDDEFVGTALHRGAMVFETEAVVEHLHPQVGKGRDDDTYRRGRRNRRADQRRHQQRRKLWIAK